MFSELDKLKNVDVKSVNPDELVDISEIEINGRICKEKRISEYIGKVKNPYCFKCGKIIVKSVFSKDEMTIDKRFENYLRAL